jgi:adenylate cyclase
VSIGMNVRAQMIELWRPGEGGVSGREVWRIALVLLPTVIVVTNVIGAGAVVVLGLFVVPLPHVHDPAHLRLVDALVAAGYVLTAVPLGVFIGTRGLWALRSWLVEERAATLREIRLVLYAPMRLFGLQFGLWSIAAVVFAVINLTYSTQVGIGTAIVVLLTGLVTASMAYLLTERLMRPGAARALAGGAAGRLVVPGVTTRALLAWTLGTGIPVVGVVTVGALALTDSRDVTFSNLRTNTVVLGGIGIAVGLLATTLAARTTADPIASVRRALARVQRGDFDVRVPVYDGSQVGQLQLGFNEMVAGLAERERIREAFGTYVDPEVAAHILEEGTDLAGEDVEVTAMFIDVRNFTGFAERTPARDVVSAINRLFERIVPIIHTHGGRVDKFIGDGLLAVFGAPRRQPDHADQALCAALEVADAVAADELHIGVGLSSGTVVAGNIGGGRRYEFSVIGDAVNVAARVEAATRQTGDRVLLAERTVELLKGATVELVERPGVELKGKRQTVRVYAAVRTRDRHTQGARAP